MAKRYGLCYKLRLELKCKNHFYQHVCQESDDVFNSWKSTDLIKVIFEIFKRIYLS